MHYCDVILHEIFISSILFGFKLLISFPHTMRVYFYIGRCRKPISITQSIPVLLFGIIIDII